MAIIASVGKGGSSFSPVSAGVHIANCIWIVDIGDQEITWQGETKMVRQVIVAWEIPEETIEIEGEEKPRVISSTYTLSLHEKAKLRKHLEAWMGKPFTDQELMAFDLVNVLGKSCQIQVLHVEKNDKTYANIGAIMALPKGSTPPTIHHEQIYFDLTNVDTFPLMDKLPEWIREKIKQSKNYQAFAAASPTSNLGFELIDDDGDLPFG